MWKKAVLAAIMTFTIVAGGALGYLTFRQPAMAPPLTEKVEPTPERLVRGRQIFEVVSNCQDCHSRRDEKRFGRPLAGEEGAGAEMMLTGFPGRMVASNLTPDPETGLGLWTDGEIIRAIREGIGRNGRVLFPIMPYSEFRHMSDEDVRAVVAYMRTLKPVVHRLPETKVNFPVYLFIKSVPRPAGAVSHPDTSDRVKYGAYLTRIAGCASCHTAHDEADLDPARAFAGGREFRTPYATVVSANISPDPDTGIGKWTEDQFIEKFYEYKPYIERGSPVVPSSGYTMMPWLSFCQWSREDLAAVFAYLKTCNPVRNPVETHPGS